MSLADDGVVQRADRSVEQRHGSLADPGDADVSPAPARPLAADPTDLASALSEVASSSFDVAVNALRKGSQDIDALSARCDQLRTELSEAQDRHRQCLRSIREEVLHWQDLVNQLVEHCRRKDQQLQEALLQRGLSEERAASELKRAQIAEQRLVTFERLVVGIHDQILSAIVKDRCDHAPEAESTLQQPEARPAAAVDLNR